MSKSSPKSAFGPEPEGDPQRLHKSNRQEREHGQLCVATFCAPSAPTQEFDHAS